MPHLREKSQHSRISSLSAEQAWPSKRRLSARFVIRKQQTESEIDLRATSFGNHVISRMEALR